ncbi:MAG TPA: DUF4235 domain-containing protein [Acidimicrobiia bacterium]|jgi:hypothetical protein
MRQLSKVRPKQLAWQGVAIASGTLAATAVRRVAVTTWRTTKHEDPPENPVARDVSWPDALTWAIAVAIGAAVARVVAQRGAAAAWERAIGEPIPVPTDAS